MECACRWFFQTFEYICTNSFNFFFPNRLHFREVNRATKTICLLFLLCNENFHESSGGIRFDRCCATVSIVTLCQSSHNDYSKPGDYKQANKGCLSPVRVRVCLISPLSAPARRPVALFSVNKIIIIFARALFRQVAKG